jgi:hypothetical protein
MMDLPVETQKYDWNHDGSCVMCSNSMVGQYKGDWSTATLLWDTEYGPAERGGASPSRVAAQMKRLGVPVHNVTGRNFESIKPWLVYAAKTGRFAGIGCFSRHYQTFWGMDESGHYLIQNNWPGTFGKPYVYSEPEMKRQSEASGAWCVVPSGPPAATNPNYVKWW